MGDVEQFYDEFLQSRMLDYRISGNLRIDMATDRILEFVHPDSHVLDVGCGVGITAERVANQVETGHVWAFDISKQNIWYARETIDNPNLTFFTADVADDKPKIKSQLPASVDVITLVDVIEHIPKDDHAGLFDFFQAITSEHSFIVLTYPSPQHQKHLKRNDPEELQIIDQVIEREGLIETAKSAGFSLRHYSLETVWKRNQYVHCVLQTDDTLGTPRTDSSSLLEKIQSRLHATWKHRVLHPFRRWKYVDRVFDD
jgi:cyclopropane fatty-acyl-phospholipid synthase-like methyltransferase